MDRSHALNLVVAVLLMVVVSVAAGSAAEASHASPFSVARTSYQLPASGGALLVADDQPPYRVKSGDTLVGIAHRFNVPVAVLAQTNGISDYDSLSEGQVLRIPVPAGEVVRAQAGDTLSTIAQRYHVSPAELAQANGLKESSRLYAGQFLRIPVAIADVIGAGSAYLKALSPLLLYSAPSTVSDIAAKMRAGEAALVTGLSADGEWLRVESVSSLSGHGWVQADSSLLQLIPLP